MRSLEEEDMMEQISAKGIETIITIGGSEGDKGPPSPVERERLDGKGRVSSEEGLEDDMQFVMQRLFVEDDVSRRINDPPPQDSGSVSPNLPLVLYNNIDKFISKFIKMIRVHSVHVNYIVTSSGGNNSSNTSLQGSLQLGSQGLVLLV